MTLLEILIGFAIALVIIAGALFFALRTPHRKGPARHNIRGNGDHATGHSSLFDGRGGGGGDGGGD